jgi:hypothetical protein
MEPLQHDHGRRRPGAAVPVLALVATLLLLIVAVPPASAAGAGTVSGVVRTQSLAPVRDAVVTLAGLRGRTGADGSYAIANVPFGSHQVDLQATCRAGGGFLGVDGNETFDLFFNEAFTFDEVGSVCRPMGTNFALDPLVSTTLPLVGDDESVHVNLPFSIRFYDSFRSALDISTNGYVTFSGASSLFNNVALTSSDAPSNAVFAFWDDLVVDQFSAVKTGVRGSTPGARIFKVRWENVRFSGDAAGARLSMELSLSESGFINIIWVGGVDATTRTQGDSATIGIKSPSGTRIQQSFNAPTLRNGLGVEYVENQAPVAAAGPDHKVASDQAFPLDATGSRDPDAGDLLTFRWTQIGSLTTIQDTRKAKTTVNGVSGPKTLTYRITVTDQFGRSSTDDVVITVKAPK